MGKLSTRTKSKTAKSRQAGPLVSVIIVNYNAGKLLTQAVKSVIDFEGVEVVVADNASKDTSFSDLKQKVTAPNLILIDNGANVGFGRAVNSAVAKSHGEYVYLLNPDASLKKTALMQMVKTARAWGNRVVVAPRLENPDGSAQPSCYPKQSVWNAIKEYWLGIKGSYSKYLPGGKKPIAVRAAVAAAWLVPRSVWDELSGLSDRFFLYFEDLDFCDRAGEKDIAIVYDPQAVVTHHHGVSSRTNPIVMKLFTESAWKYHGWFKKLTIDVIIRIRDLFTPPVSWKKLAGVAVTYTVLVTAIATIGYFLLPSRMSPSPLVSNIYHSNFLLWSWANFDGEHYLRIAEEGYQTIMGQSEYAFFPFYPLLIKLVSSVGLSTYASAHFVTLASALGFMFIFVKWARRYVSNPLTVLWIVLLSPGAIYLSALYTEPLFLLLATLTFYHADRGEWGRAILATALATATRVNSIFLVLFLLLKMTKNKWAAFLGMSGLCTYMLYLYSETGNALSWYTAQAGWGKAEPTWPWVTATNYVRALTTEFVPDLTHLVVTTEVVITAILIYLTFKFVWNKKFHLAYKAYAIGAFAMPLTTGSLGSMPRFSLALFPLFLIIPTLSKFPRLITQCVFLLTAILGIILFTRGYWYA